MQATEAMDISDPKDTSGKPPRPDQRPERAERERPVEQREGITPERRGSPAAPSDRPENEPPHPQDINDMSR